jgi:hypothetical protein
VARQQYLEIANFILRFGDRLKMIDMFEEIVLPAFVGDGERSYKDTRYMFLNVKLVTLEHRDRKYPAVVGRFVKDTKLKRNQLFDSERKGLVKSEVTLDTAPSSVFVLMLDGHRLLFVREQSDSPGLDAFRSTVIKFVTSTYYDYLDKLYDEAKANPPPDGKKVTRKIIERDFPKPTLELIEVSAEQELREFVGRYKTLKDIRVSLVQTNDEVDNEDFFRQMRVQKNKIGSDKTTLQHHQKDGLNKSEAIEQLQSALNGTAEIRLEGISTEGEKLIGNNEQFKVRVPLGEIGDDVKDAAQGMFNIYMMMIESKRISVNESPPATRVLIDKVAELFVE